MKNKVLLFTFDFEMFMGLSGTIDNCLIYPTDRLLKLLHECKIKATFFVDVAFLVFLKRNNQVEALKKVSDEISKILENGNRVEMHLHPQWIDAVYEEGGKHCFFKSYRYYKICDCPSEIVDSLFREGYSILSEIGYKFDRTYSIKGYRAGGWCVDPFEQIGKLFNEFGIIFDSSVIPKGVVSGELQKYDYSDIQPIPYYYFKYNVHSPNNIGPFLEFPISTQLVQAHRKVCRFLERKLHPSDAVCFGDGKSISIFKSEKVNTLKFYYSKLLKREYEFASLDGFQSISLLSEMVKNNDLTTFVGHPKSLTNRSLECIKYLGFNNLSMTIYDYILNI